MRPGYRAGGGLSVRSGGGAAGEGYGCAAGSFRAALVCSQRARDMRLETWMEPSRSTMAPWAWSRDFFMCRLIMATPSTRARRLSARISSDLALFALVGARNDDDLVAAFDVEFLHGQRTSGASEMIFMKFLERSSRATGPKMRVPRGFPSASMMTMALLSKRR